MAWTRLSTAALLGATLFAAPGLRAQPAITQPAAAVSSCPSVLDREVLRLQDEKPQNLCQYAGKVVLVVNTASFCGFTPQYKGLEALQTRYATRGLVVLGFPSTDFGQEFTDNKQIADFCDSTFGVRFPMFTKTRVVASAAAPASALFADLKQRTGQAPGWNFHKYLIARDGNSVVSFGSRVEPEDAGFVRTVERLLAEKP